MLDREIGPWIPQLIDRCLARFGGTGFFGYHKRSQRC